MNISQKKLEKSRGRLEITIKDQNLQKLIKSQKLTIKAVAVVKLERLRIVRIT